MKNLGLILVGLAMGVALIVACDVGNLGPQEASATDEIADQIPATCKQWATTAHATYPGKGPESQTSEPFVHEEGWEVAGVAAAYSDAVIVMKKCVKW